MLEEELPDALPNTDGAQGPDADDPAPDAGLESDASFVQPEEAGEPDANCADRDEDGVCDADDNCPDASNSGQADADGDGVGDACEMTQVDAGTVACQAETLPASVKAGEATISNVRVNGGGTSAKVSKGQRVSVSFDYAFEMCSVIMTAQLQSVVVGLEGQSMGTCMSNALPCPAAATGTNTISIEAPNRSGMVYVVLAGRHHYPSADCDSLSGAQRLAVLCVE